MTMSATRWVLDQIEVSVTGFFTTHHHFETESGTLGELTLPAFDKHATFEAADGRTLTMRKTSWFGNTFEIAEDDLARGRAEKKGFFSRDIVLVFGGQPYTLTPEGLFSRGWLLLDAEGNTLIEIQPRGIFKQGAYLTMTGVIEADLAVFAYYLVHVRQQEEAAAAAAS